MRIIFTGTPDFAKTVLEKLVASEHKVVAVFTTPDAVSGRGKKLLPTPVKVYAQEQGIDAFTPDSLKDPQVVEQIRVLSPDCIVVASYRMLIPQEILDIPVHGCLNVHPSLLPRWRGAAPIQRAILSGDELTGVCVMKMTAGLDAGDITAVRTTPLDDKYCDELFAELAESGAEALLDTLGKLESGEQVYWQVQDDEYATYAAKVDKKELRLDPQQPAAENLRRIRASSSSTPAKALVLGKPVTILKAHLSTSDFRPGTANATGGILRLGCPFSTFTVDMVKPDGSKAMDAASWLRGLQGIKDPYFTWERF